MGADSVAPRWTPYSDSLMSSRRARTDSSAWVRLQARVKAGELAGNEAAHCREVTRIATPPTFGDTGLARLAPDVCRWRNEWPSRIGPYFGAQLPSLGDLDWGPELGKVPVPRLVIHRELENTLRVGDREWVVGQANTRLPVVPGAGHRPQLERPDESCARSAGGRPLARTPRTAGRGISHRPA